MTTRGVLSGFSSINTNIDQDQDYGPVSVSTSAEALALVSALARTVATSSGDVANLLEQHITDPNPHKIKLSDTHIPLIESAISDFISDADMTVIDPLLSTTKRIPRTISYGNVLVNSTVHAQYINERSYLQMNRDYTLELLSPSGVTVNDIVIDDIRMLHFSGSQFSISERAGDRTIAFYVDIPDTDDITVALNGDIVISTRRGSRLGIDNSAYIRNVKDTLYGIYLFRSLLVDTITPVTVTLTSGDVPDIIGLRAYNTHAVIDGVRTITSPDESVIIPLPRISDGYSVGVSYMVGRSAAGLWLTVGTSVSIEIINNQKCVTITNGSDTVQGVYPAHLTDHSVSLVTFYDQRISWTDTIGNMLELNCSDPLIYPDNITAMPNDGYIGGIICAPSTHTETMISHLTMKG